MSSAQPDRVKLSTGATTIVRVPIARGKSGTGTAAFWTTAPDLNSREPSDPNGANGQHQASGMPPIPGAGAVPWRDAVTATSSKSLLLSPDSRSRRRLMLGGDQQSNKAMMGLGSGGGGGGGTAAATAGVSFRRNGLVSAPVVSSTAAAAAGGGGAAESARLPAIGSMSRSAAVTASGTAPRGSSSPPPPPVTGIAALPTAIRGAIRRSIVSLPSINGADAGGGGGGDGDAADEGPPPVVVSFGPSRPTSGGKTDRATRRALSRPAVRVLVNGVIVAATGGGDGGGGGGDRGGNEDVNASNDASTSDCAAGAPVAAAAAVGKPGGGSGGLFRGIRRLLGKEASGVHPSMAGRAAAAATAAAVDDGGGGGGGGGDGAGDGGGDGEDGNGGGAAANAAGTTPIAFDDTVRQDDTSSSLNAQRSSTSVLLLAKEYVREQERVSRLRSSLLGFEARAVLRQGAGSGAPSPLAAEPSRSSVEMLGDLQALRSGKSFAHRAMEDPRNPAFKTAKQLADVQDKLSYMESKSWREKAAELASQERPILMAEGWKV